MVSRDKTIGHALSLPQKRRTYGACATAFAIICTGVQQGNVTVPKEYVLREPTCSSANRDRAGGAGPVQIGGSGFT